jgi:hypothetical protein
VLLGLIDTAMVGTLGNAALGAVGLSSFAAFIFLGCSSGSRSLCRLWCRAAPAKGETHECARPCTRRW